MLMTLGGEAIEIKKSPPKKKRYVPQGPAWNLRQKGQLDNFIKKKKTSGNFMQLVLNKDFSKIN